MSIRKISFYAETQGPVDFQVSDDLLQVEESYRIGPSVRGINDKKEVSLQDNKLVEFTFEDGTTWLCSPDTIEEVFPQAANPARSAEGTFEIPQTLHSTGVERGIASDIGLKLIKILTKKALETGVHKTIHDLAEKLEKRQLENQSGLYRLEMVNEGFNLSKFEPVAGDKPFLLFLHGTSSSTKGSFEELAKSKAWDEIYKLYGSNILAFQHETLTKSPLQNALELVQQLPKVIDLHLISHSRGGLIGDILARFCNGNENNRGFDQREKNYLQKEERKDRKDTEHIEQLEKELKSKQVTISKFVRVACPANGTILASKRLDIFFNVLLNLIGLGTGIALYPAYGVFKSLVAAVLESKNSLDALPGIEAMNPESPFIKVLNNPGTTIEIDSPLAVISGNCQTAFNLRALLIIAGKLFYATHNDLVVNTLSMYQGSKRQNKLNYFFDQAGNVDHFHYFKNPRTSDALLAALRGEGDLAAAGFKWEQQKILVQTERNALIKADGGKVFKDTVTGTKPLVLLLPGIMGSNLAINGRAIWINYLHFLGGGLQELDVETQNVTASSLVGTSYKKLVDYLSASYDVVTFPYDWRLPLTDSADGLNKRINELLQYGQPIKIIGHSMGGVLMRDFILKHENTWKTLNKLPGFRLVFLGAPLGGSFRIPAVLCGMDAIINKLSKIDIIHTKKQLLGYFSKMKGLLSLLPLSEEASSDFAQGNTWNEMAAALDAAGWPLPVEKGKVLEWFKEYRDNIRRKSDEIDYTNAVYIAGKDKATPCGYRIDDTGRGKELVFLSTGEGDQSATWDSGIPKKLISRQAVYYVNVTHGALANEPKLFEGIAEILEKGSTGLLSKNRPAVRGEEKIFRSVEPLDFDLSEEGVTSTLLGLDTEEATLVTEAEAPLEVSVSAGHLKYASFPVLVGHFQNDGILNAEKEVDNMLTGALSDRHRLGLYPGEIGSSEVIIYRGDEGLKGGIVVGLGSFGALTQFQLTRTIEQGVSKYLLDVNSKRSLKGSLGRDQLGLSSLIIGCGYGGLSIESSVRAIIQGIQNANTKIRKMFDGLGVIEQLEFIEMYEDRALSCFYSLSKIEKDPSQLLNISITKKEIKERYGSRKRILSQSTEGWWNRITITMDDNTDPADTIRLMEFSISTGAAREERRDLYINPAVIDSMVYDSSTTNLGLPKLAKTFFEILIPVDFKEQLKRQDNIIWILNERTASFPWELLQDNIADAKPLSVNAGMIRQLGTQDYRLKINAVASNNALVVGEPILNGFLPDLPGALKEGRMVADLIKANGFDVTPLLKDTKTATARNILQELHEGYKIIHLAGHGNFDKKSPRHSGMVIGKDFYLTTADFANMSTVPELVFINCCHLGTVDSEAEKYYRNVYKLAANIGTQLIKNGVKAVVAAGWAVNDAAALRFAEKFYQDMFDGEPFGDAVRNARETIYKEFPQSNTWGAYQCYGDPFYKFRDDRKINTQFTKEFVVAQEAEIELSNLWGKLKTGRYTDQDVRDQLAAISQAVDAAGIRRAVITEKEALLYAEISDYGSAISKFQQLLVMEKADFSVSTLEKYNNIRMKKYVAEYLEAVRDKKKPDEQRMKTWREGAGNAIQGLESLLQISPTAERYNLLGSAYKRMGILCKKVKKSDAYRRAAYYYREAFHRHGNYDAYALTNWYALESVLVAANHHEWGKETPGEDYKYQLPAKEEAKKDLEAIINLYRPNNGSMDYWILMEAPNCKLCSLILNPDPDDQDKWNKMLDTYKEVWNKVGSKGDKFAEVEHLQLLSDALTLAGKENTVLKDRIDTLKDKLEKMIG